MKPANMLGSTASSFVTDPVGDHEAVPVQKIGGCLAGIEVQGRSNNVEHDGHLVED